jgi:hypothetical protein
MRRRNHKNMVHARSKMTMGLNKEQQRFETHIKNIVVNNGWGDLSNTKANIEWQNSRRLV